jgi:cytochrome c oxidase subunit 2
MTSNARRARAVVLLLASALAGSCSGIQSALDPAGREAERMADIFMWMTVSFTIVWLGVVALAMYAPRAGRRTEGRGSRRAELTLILGGGVIFPVTVLTLLLVFGLGEVPRILARAPAGNVMLEVEGSQWWWRVRYLRPGTPAIELANEIRLPLNTRVDARLMSSDVVHSFWAPTIAGKMDLIPGRVNVLPLEATRTGTFRGACAEFCGTSHARMNFPVVVMEEAAFDRWLDHQATDAMPPASAEAERGQQLFMLNGCQTCHSVRGVTGRSSAGPDLTHVGSRLTIAAGTLPATRENFRRWIAHTHRIKPEARMPAFHALDDEELDALAVYLEGLQ